MAAHSNRSPSLLSSKPTNPNLRNSESSSALRRSIGSAKPSVLTNPGQFDPATPANSPSDCLRRSVGKERISSSLGDWEEKENQKDHNIRASKLRSLGPKNFMSPTISAASKFTPSPKKKILVERNDPVRTSMTLSDGKVVFFSSTNVSEDMDSKSEVASNLNQTKQSSSDINLSEAAHDIPPVSKNPKRVTFLEVPSDSHHEPESLSITDSDDTRKLESSSKSKAFSSYIAPLDADPSLPPYDPKTNYLSPRPQFLHYKPNPRIEIMFKNDKGLDPSGLQQQLEDSFFAEFSESSDSEGTAESQTDDSKNEESEFTNSGCSDDMVLGIEETVVGPIVSEPKEALPVTKMTTDAVSKEKKARGLSKWMCFSIILVFLIACASISVDHYAALDQLDLKGMNFSDLSKFYDQFSFVDSAKVHFERLAWYVYEFADNTVSFVYKLIGNGKGVTLSPPLQFMNITNLQNYVWDERNFLKNHVSLELEEDLDNEMCDVFEEEEEEYYEIDSSESSVEEFDNGVDLFEEETFVESVSDNEITKAVFESENQEIVEINGPIEDLGNKISENQENPETSVLQDKEIKIETEMVEVVAADVTEDLGNKISENQENPETSVLQDKEIKIETEMVEVVAADVTEAEKFYGDNIIDSSAPADTTKSEYEGQLDVSSSLNDQSSPELENPKTKFVEHHVIGISSLLASSLCALAAFFICKMQKNPVALQTKSALSKPMNLQTEVDELSSCPSEMSSFQKNVSSYSKKNNIEVESEFQSFERKQPRKNNTKRESLASSSGTPSYGSFTTFERIPIKNENGDDEIVTPVRRSSRIRKQVISP